MIQTAAALSFAPAAAAMVMTPGAGFVLFSRTMLTHGRRAALSLVGGIMAGTALLATIVVLAYPLLIGGIAGLKRGLQLGGGFYLVYLGVRGILRAREQRTNAMATDSVVHGPATNNTLAFEGVTSAITNPGLFVVYVLLLPSYVPQTAPWMSTAALLAAEHFVINMAWYSMLFVAMGRARGYFSSRRRQTAVAIGASCVLIGLGVRTLVHAFGG